MTDMDYGALKCMVRAGVAFGLLIPLEAGGLAEAGMHDLFWPFFLVLPPIILIDCLALFWVITGEIPHRRRRR